MRAPGAALLLALALASGAVDCRQLGGWVQDVPARCAALAATATAVSCERMPPDELAAHPDDCQLFYYCVRADAAPVCRQCPAGLHFNPALRVCDRPAAAGCTQPAPAPAPATSTEGPVDP